MWSKEQKEEIVKQGSLSVNGHFRLGECYEGTIHRVNGENKVFFSDEHKTLMRNPHADICPCSQIFCEGEKVKVRITYIFPSSGMACTVEK